MERVQGKRPGRHLTVDGVCEDLGVTKSTFYEWRAKRKAPPCVKLPNGSLRVRRVDYERWLENLDQDVA
jgi:predicted DNA-binding transcriptional regulator AlpA